MYRLKDMFEICQVSYTSFRDGLLGWMKTLDGDRVIRVVRGRKDPVVEAYVVGPELFDAFSEWARSRPSTND